MLLIRNSKLWFLILVGVVAAGNRALAEDLIYIQALKVDLKQTPSMSGASVETLKRGDSLTLISKEEVWYKVKHITKGVSHEGYVSKLFVSTHPPIGQADLNKDLDATSVEQASRRRSSSYAVSASTRGLRADERVRDGRLHFQSDFPSLKRIEDYQVDQGKLDTFRTSAKLNE